MKHFIASAPAPRPPAHLIAIPGFKSKSIEATKQRREIKIRKLQKQRGRCRYCTQEISVNEATTEHRKPLARGGTDTAKNIDAACQPCNKAKRKLTKREFELAIFNPNMRRDPWPLYVARVEIRLKRAAEKACRRLAAVLATGEA